jgi:hypothetical protein
MRTLTARPAAALATSSATVARVLCIEWPGAAALYYTDALPTWTLATGYSAFEPIVQTWPAPAPAADKGVVCQGQFSGCSFTLLQARIASDNPTGARVILYEVVKPLTGTNVIGDWIVLGVYRVVSVTSTGRVYAIECEDYHAHLGDEPILTDPITVANYPDAPADSLGRLSPLALGTLTGVPLIPLNGSPSITLAASIDASSGALYTLDDISDATEWPASGWVRVDNEILGYTVKAVGAGGAESSLGSDAAPLIRGAYNSVAAEHSIGAAARRILTDAKAYEFLVSGHDAAIQTVYADGQPVPANKWRKRLRTYPARSPDCIVGVDWNPPAKNAGTANESRMLTDPTSDALVPQAVWETPDAHMQSGDVRDSENAVDGSSATFATMAGGATAARLGTRMRTRYAQLAGLVSLRRLELRLRYQAYTPKGDAWPNYAPTLAVGMCNAADLSLATMADFTSAPIVRPLDMGTITNLYPNGHEDDNSTLLFQTQGTDSETDSVSFGTSDFRYWSGAGSTPVAAYSFTMLYWNAFANVLANGTVAPVLPSGYPMIFAEGSTLPDVGSIGDTLGFRPHVLIPTLKLGLHVDDPDPKPTSVTNIKLSVTIAAENKTYHYRNPTIEIQLQSATGHGYATLNSHTLLNLTPETLELSYAGVLSYNDFKNLRVALYVPYADKNIQEAWEMASWTYSNISLTATYTTTTHGVTLTGKSVPLLANSLIPSPVIEQRVDLTPWMGDWGLFPGEAAGANRLAVRLEMQAGTSNQTVLYVYEFGLFAEWTRQTSADVDLSERVFTADIRGLGGHGVAGAFLSSADLWNLIMPVLAGAQWDGPSLTAALAATGTTVWPVARYFGDQISKADLLAEMAVSTGVRWGIDSGKFKFFPSLVPLAGETARLAITPDLMLSAGQIPDYHVDLMKNRVVARFAFVPGTDNAGTVTAEDTHAQGGNWGVRQQDVEFRWISSAANAATLAAWLLGDAALVKSGFNVTLVEFKCLTLELGDVVTVVDAYAQYPETRGRVIGVGRSEDGLGAVYTILTGTAISGGTASDHSSTDPTTLVSVDQTDNSLAFYSAGVLAARLDSSGVLWLKGKVIEGLPIDFGEIASAPFTFSASAGLWLCGWVDAGEGSYVQLALIDSAGNLQVERVAEYGADAYPTDPGMPNPYVMDVAAPLARYGALDPALTAIGANTITAGQFSTDGMRTMLHAAAALVGGRFEGEIRCRRVMENAL